jgi:DNA replication and repair protein RecF
MILNRIKLVNFRNYDNLEITFSPEINFITGNNGSGKTNIIEAISVISNLKSFRNISDESLIKWENSSYYCSGDVSGSEYSKFEVGYSIQSDKPKKKIKIDSSEIKKVSDYYGKLITVNFIPTDINIINGPPDIRRRYFDSVISKIYPEYIDELNKYRDICFSRNLLLKKIREKNSDAKLLDAWNRIYSEKACLILKKRRSFIDEFNRFFMNNYLKISNEESSPVINYSSTLKSEDYDDIYREININLSNDLRRGTTQLGPHRDDYIIRNDGCILFSSYASQGQKRAASICLKMSEVEIIKKIKQKKSIILIDDIFSELDEIRRNSMIDLLQGEGQIIFTMVKNYYGNDISFNTKHFYVSNGKVSNG